MPKSTHKNEDSEQESLDIDLTRLDEGWPDISAMIRPAVVSAFSEIDDPFRGSLSVVLTDDAHIQTLNRTYRDQDKPTNVLSFPMPPATGLMGDVILARETIQREARDQGKSFADHFCHMLIHGVLHLQGLDHQEEAAAQDMEQREICALKRLSIDNPYASNKG